MKRFFFLFSSLLLAGCDQPSPQALVDDRLIPATAKEIHKFSNDSGMDKRNGWWTYKIVVGQREYLILHHITGPDSVAMVLEAKDIPVNQTPPKLEKE